MLGKTAGGLYWMFRYLERSENTARLIEAGLRIALTRSSAAESEWESILQTAVMRDAYQAKYTQMTQDRVIDFILRDPDNPASVLSMIKIARDNARLVRTALTREVWEAVNECWIVLSSALHRPVFERDLPHVLTLIRQRSAFVRGAMAGSVMRNDNYDFMRLGTFLERADNTARILDVKYYVLLPSAMPVGSSLDNVQWETLLRSLASTGAFRSAYGQDVQAAKIAQFLLLDPRFPRSLAFCFGKIRDNLGYLANDYGTQLPSHDIATALAHRFAATSTEAIFKTGLHEFLQEILGDAAKLGRQIETDYRFYG